MTVHDELIDGYLDRLESAARALPAARRAELLTEIREHITVALAESPDQSEATLRTILDRLGDPESIVREAGGAPAAPDSPAATADDSRYARVPLWLIGLGCGLLVLAGYTLPLLGVALGAVVARVLASRQARRRPQAFLIWPVALGAVAAACYVGVTFFDGFGIGVGSLELAILAAPLLLGGIVGALIVRRRRRGAAIGG